MTDSLDLAPLRRVYRVTFVLGETSSGRGALAGRAIRLLRRALVDIDSAFLKAHPETPAMLGSGVKVVDQDEGPEEWSDIPSMMDRGYGSLESLAAWRSAELRVKSGVVAYPKIPRAHVVISGACPDARPRSKCAPGHRVTFALSIFGPEEDRPLAHNAVAHMLRALTEIDVEYLKHRPETPRLYQSGIRYREEPPGQEDWNDTETCLELGDNGNIDCEDLACWRAAELQVKDRVRAWPSFLWRRRPRGGLLYHIQTKYPDGRVEDPSRRLGMR